MSAQPSASPPPISLAAVAVTPALGKGSKQITSGELSIGSDQYKLIPDDDGTLRRAFRNVELSQDTPITLHYRTSSFRPRRTLQMESRHLLANHAASLTQDLPVVRDGIQITFSMQDTERPLISHVDAGPSKSHPDGSLSPTTKAILEDCPQFRILVIGETGVGKTSLIRTAFGIDEPHPTGRTSRKSGIALGLQSPVNDRLILHDSIGFEAGDTANYETVKDFIRGRRTGPLKDRLHAIWFCIPTPRAGGRLFGTGAEDFFRMKEAIIGTIPIIVVYTKLDMSVTEWMMQLRPTSPGLGTGSLEKLACSEAESSVRKRHQGINQLANESLPYVVISIESLKHTLQNLVELTYRQVVIPGTPEARTASFVTLMAQRVSPGLKVNGTIDVGRRKYWKALRASPHFQGRTISDCLSVIHTDIVTVWNFNDPNRYLLDKEFQRLVTDLTRKKESAFPNFNWLLATGDDSLAAVTTFLAAMSDPTAPIALPTMPGAGVPLPVYSDVPGVQQTFIAYIVDLTHIMEALFILAARHHDKLTRRVIKAAYVAYHNSSQMNQAHASIRNHRDIDGRDTPLELIESLLKPEQHGDSAVKYYAKINELDLAKFKFDMEEEW